MQRTLAALVTGLIGLGLLALSAAPANADDDIWNELRDLDGTVILFRHALAPGGGDPADFDVSDCSTQRNLSAAGRIQSRDMGRQLRKENVDVARVLSSPWCRSRQTAELMGIGSVRPMMRFGSVFTASSSVADRRRKLSMRTIARHAQRDGVLVIVGHQANIIDLTGIAPASGEGVVVRFRETEEKGEVGASVGGGGLEILGRVPAPAIR